MLIPYVLSVALSYLLGSIPFALGVGKLFYKTDIRQHGSGNLGGGNAGRVLGKKAGLAVMTLDILKVTLAIYLSSLMLSGQKIMVISGLAAALGHCFPLFAGFRGGKAVATMYGFLFSMVTVAHCNPLLFFLPLLVFLLILFVTRIIALSSIGSAVTVALYTAFFEDSALLCFALTIFTVIIIVRHWENLERIREHRENKVSWIRK